eukprot:scaffold1348_cov279-Pinguiococcus_pyrenoidosus.AAC.1
MSEDEWNDREFVLEAMRQDGEDLEYVSEELRNDPDVVRLAIENGCLCSLHCVPDALLKHPDVILALLATNEYPPIELVDEELLGDPVFMLQALWYSQELLERAEELRNDREFMLAAIRACEVSLLDAPQEFQSDREFVLEAVSASVSAFRFGSDELHGDREVVLAAVRKD